MTLNAEFDGAEGCHRQEALLQAVPDILLEIDAGRKCVWANAPAREFFGADIAGRNMSALFSDDSRGLQEMDRLFSGGGIPLEISSCHTRCDGARRTLNWRFGPRLNPEGTVIGVVASARETASQEVESYFRGVFDSVNDAIVVHELGTWRIVDVNRRTCELFRISYEEALQTSVAELSAGDGQYNMENARSRLEQAAAGHPQLFEWHARDSAGRLFWVEVNMQLGSVAGVSRLVVSVRDVTERVALRDQIASLARFPEESTNCVLRSAGNGTLLYANPASAILLRHWKSEVNGFLPPDLCGLVSHCVETGERTTREITCEGKTISIEFVAVPGTGYCNLYGRDLTEQKAYEGKLARLAMAIAYAAEAIVVTDTDGVITYVNPAFERITGYSAVEALGQNPRMLKSGVQDDRFYAEMWDTIRRGEVWSGRLVNRRKNGQLYEEETIISPVRDASGEVVSYVDIKRDVSGQMELDRRLRQAQKMEAIGTLAGGIAHDFNNILAAIMGYGEIVLGDLEPGSQQWQDMQSVLSAAQRAKELVHQILTFSRRVEEEQCPLSLGTIVKEAQKLLRPSLPATIHIQTDVQPDVAYVLADATQMHQVLINLCTNAYHAMRETGGTLSVAVENYELDSAAAQAIPNLAPGPYVRLTVSDTGIGMDKATLERIFEPFFTTKPKGEGTGLGLATVHGIVSSAGGAITVYSEIGQGTTFHVYLPAVSRNEDAAHPALPAVRGGNERILVLDDEPALSRLLQKALSPFGYEVISMTSSSAALAAIRVDPNLFDLVITDQTMPGMTGVQLAAEVHGLRADLPIVMTTGLADVPLDDSLRNVGIAAILHKPAGTMEVARLVRDVLDGK